MIKVTTENSTGQGIALYVLQDSRTEEEVKQVSASVLRMIKNLIETSDNIIARKIGIRLAERSLKHYLMRKFPVFIELENLELLDVSLHIVDNESKLVLVPVVSYPFSTEKIPTPGVSFVKNIVNEWVYENNFALVMPFFVVNSETS